VRYTEDRKSFDGAAQTLIEICTRTPPPGGPGCVGGPSVPVASSLAQLAALIPPTLIPAGLPSAPGPQNARPFGASGNLLFYVPLALLFLEHGTQKFFGFPSAFPFGAVPPLSMLGVAGGLELVGGALILLGLFTRPVAFLLSGQMAVGYFLVHATRGFYPIDNGGEPAILFFIFLALSATGPGTLSLDGLRAARSPA